MNVHEKHTYKNPLAAALWSIFLPGLGQLYNRDYVIGFLLLFLEIIFNWAARLNLAIYYAFIGDSINALESIDFQWALFYPSFYAFSAWQAYNRAVDINRKLSIDDIKQPGKTIFHSGLFIGMAVGLNLGLQWGLNGNPIFGSLTGGILGAILGFGIEWLMGIVKIDRKGN